MVCARVALGVTLSVLLPHFVAIPFYSNYQSTKYAPSDWMWCKCEEFAFYQGHIRSDGWSAMNISSFIKGIFLCTLLNAIFFLLFTTYTFSTPTVTWRLQGTVMWLWLTAGPPPVLSHAPAILKPFSYHYLWLYFTNKPAFGDKDDF